MKINIITKMNALDFISKFIPLIIKIIYNFYPIYQWIKGKV